MNRNVAEESTRPGYGTRTIDLSDENTDKLLQTPNATGVAILKADAPATIKIQDKNNPGISVKDLGGLNFKDTPVDSFYVSNSAASSGDELVVLWSTGTVEADLNTPEEVDITDRSGRQIGKIQEDSPLDVSGAQVETASATLSSINQDQQSVTSSGANEALNDGNILAVPDGATVTVRAETGNSDSIYVGDSGVSIFNGFELESGESVTLAVDDVSTIFIDADTDGDGVRWIVEG